MGHHGLEWSSARLACFIIIFAEIPYNFGHILSFLKNVQCKMIIESATLKKMHSLTV